MKHDVTFSIPERDLGRADVQFIARAGGDLLGLLAVSKGSLVWFEKDHTYGHRLDWRKLGELMATHGVRLEKRRK